MKFEIKSRWTATILFAVETETFRLAVEAGVKSGTNLYGADLRDADLRGADLRGAGLYGTNLYGANLRDANLRDAGLYGADLYGANLYGANLRDANLYGADLRDANLRGADLYGANLRDANLRGAGLRGANLRDANLYGTNLYGADLRDARIFDAHWVLPPPQIVADHYIVRAVGIDLIACGCKQGTLEWWEEQHVGLAADEAMSEQGIALYRIQIEAVAALLKLYRDNGWVTAIKLEAAAVVEKATA